MATTRRSGIRVMAADAALKAEERRLRIHNEAAKEIPNIPHKDFEKFGRKMFRIVSQITGTAQSVRGIVKLDPRVPKKSPGVPSVDPEPNWTLDDLLSELNALESKLGYQTSSPLTPSQFWNTSKREAKVSNERKPFIMSISDDDTDECEDESDGESVGEVSDNENLVTGCRFSCIDLDLSDAEESDDALHLNTTQCSLMHKNSLEKAILLELEMEHELKVKELVRNTLSTLESCQQKECERLELITLQLRKYIQDRREVDRRVDKQYQRKIAEELDDHLSAVQRDHEQRSQIEERRIRHDAAIEEAKQKEKALYDEKVHREKVKGEEEAREKAAKLAEERRLALEAAQKVAEKNAKKAAEEAAQKEAKRAAAEAALKAAEHKVNVVAESVRGREGQDSSSQESGIRVMAADAALKAEERRLRIHNEAAKEIPNIPHKDFEKFGRKMFRIVSQITGTAQSVREKAIEIINTINGSAFPRSISILIFAQKIVSCCETPRATDDRLAFACARIIVLVSSQVPSAMDIVLTELNKACIYTVPKHLHPSNPSAQDFNYWKMVGYHEEGDGMEKSSSYLTRMQSYMKLYAAMIQTDIHNARNPHGLEQGWAWLAMFINSLPPNRSTAFALEGFLRMAGYALYSRYKSQFMKMLNVISQVYLPALKRHNDPEMGKIIKILETYLEDKLYRKEPNGHHLEEVEILSEVLSA